ncbi:hypothetical protein [Methylocapsa sp. S129]|uniref:hypothetical protein n=1 Tax=Methylocapsa sp. S129 TaxID=1641869 RepID=UPI00131B2FCC|nr:hypothetical protein [Methylocapsa sp. S129]
MTRKSTPISLRDKVAIFAILSIILAAIAYAAYRPVGQPSALEGTAGASMIYAGLPADAGEANATFRARVSSAFPLLTPEDSLIQTLSRQGFKSDGWFAKRMTFRRQHGSLRGCDFTASVTWESDDHARVKTLETRFMRSPGCVDSVG